MKKLIIGLALVLVSAPALGEAKRGGTLYDSEGKRVGTISRVLPDGALSVIVQGRLVVVPAQSVIATDDRVTTSLSRAAVRKL